ncbi:MAG: hypothetical protein FWE05_13685 [Defluviitaleaceae bacterium]|nr:hypothetical protein [Defluviitaleaceae bacterium]
MQNPIKTKRNNFHPLLLAIATFIMALILTFGPTVFFAIWENINNREEIVEQRDWVIPFDKQHFVSNFWFHTQITVNGEILSGLAAAQIFINPAFYHFDPYFDTLILVYSEEEAQGFPDNVVLAWPMEDNWLTQEQISILNDRIMWSEELIEQHTRSGLRPRSVLGIEGLEERFGLTYPITTRDLVDHWQQIVRLWDYLHSRGFVV